LRVLLSALAARGSREAEVLVLRQQLLVLSRKAPKRVRLRNIDLLILVWLSRLFLLLSHNGSHGMVALCGS
jgi:hypothetical protein